MTPTPHDALFKSIFSQPRQAMEVVRAALPPEVTRHLALDSAELAPGSFVDEALKERHSDLLFRVSLDGREAFAYLLFEHQSSADALMPYRVLLYMAGIWKQWLEVNPDAARLPAILPVVLSHAKGGWTAASTFVELYDLDPDSRPDLSPWLVDFKLAVEDLAQHSDLELRARVTDALTRLVLLALKHARSKDDLVPLLGEWMDLLQQVADAPHGVEALILVMRYLYQVTPLTRPDAVRVFEAAQVGAKVKEAVMTGGELLINEGLERGLQKGRLEGEQGLLIRHLRRRFGALPEHLAARIEAGSSDDIDHWLERVHTASTIDDVFALDGM